MENDFLDGVYWEEWYNDGDEDWRTKMPCSANQIEFTDKKKGPKGTDDNCGSFSSNKLKIIFLYSF